MAAKKSNKTEHVLKLITKNDETSQEDDYFGIDQEIPAAETEPEAVPAPAQQETPAEPEPEIRQEASTEPAPEIRQEAPAEPVMKEESAASAEQPKDSPLVRAFREQEQAAATANIDPEPEDDLVNIAELLAREKLTLVMERMKVCSCKTCRNDVLALALNSLPTKYVTTDAGKQYFQRDVYKKQYETDILAALTKACVRVKASPRH